MYIKEYLNSEEFNKEHNLYIIKVCNINGEEIIKIGYSSNIFKRLKSYYSHNPFTEVLETLYIKDGLCLEVMIHEIIPLVKNTNEWHPIEFLETIKTILIQKIEINKLKQDMEIMKKFIKNSNVEDIII